jgi:glycosyltransferase involved in cell wall biosynthesis
MSHHAVIIYHSFNDPIFKGLMLKYLVAYQQECKHVDSFHVITFEQSAYKIPEEEQTRIHSNLSDNNLFWYPLRYSGGSFLVIKKTWDLVVCLRSVIKLHRIHTLKSIIGFTSISGVISYMIARVLRLKCIAMNIEPHSDFMIDFKIWKRNGFKYFALKFLENRLIENGDHIALPSRNAFLYWEKRKQRGKVYFVPTCIDLNDFEIPFDSKQTLKLSLGLPTDKRVILYVGKFDGIYYKISEAAELMRKLLAVNPDVFFYIITPDDLEQITRKLNLNGLEGSYLLRGKIPYEQISKHIASADFGIVFIPPYPNQQYRCPIKTANYLACGIPYIIAHNVGDDSALAIKEDVGIVIDYSHMSLPNFNHPVEFYRQVAKKYRDLSIVVNFLKISLADSKY